MNLDYENLSTDYEDRCGNCQSFMEESDKYCKYCGTAKGAGKFEPYKNTILVLYGPPITLKYNCNQCNAKWNVTGVLLNDEEVKYCPQCKSTDIKIAHRETLY
jgi:RNA polymerase subunit RPABC4/transcription elongation factor Spt4